MKLTLVKKLSEAKNTKSFFWKSDRNIKYLPGQYMYFTLPRLNYSDPKGSTRHFTLSSSPTEGLLLRFTTHIRNDSGFKKTLDELEIGQTIEAEGPSGTFILDEKERGLHFLIAGGIGITPFRSFIKYNTDMKLIDIKINLLHSNSLPQEIAFEKEFENISDNFNNINIAQTITRTEYNNNRKRLTGRIDSKMLKKLLNQWDINIKNVTFWLCGPPDMVNSLERLLGTLKITADKVRSEKFTGY